MRRDHRAHATGATQRRGHEENWEFETHRCGASRETGRHGCNVPARRDATRHARGDRDVRPHARWVRGGGRGNPAVPGSARALAQRPRAVTGPCPLHCRWKKRRAVPPRPFGEPASGPVRVVAQQHRERSFSSRLMASMAATASSCGGRLYARWRRCRHDACSVLVCVVHARLRHVRATSRSSALRFTWRGPSRLARILSSQQGDPLRRALGQAKRLTAPSRGRAIGRSELKSQR